MVRSLYSGVSGLTTHQQRMDVIGNNIANVNTYGFKASRVTFRDVYYQTSIGETAGTHSFAGNNPSTVGYGVQMGSIDKDMSMSSFQSTNRVLDVAISGDGFFITSTFDGSQLNAEDETGMLADPYNIPPKSTTYTRMGNFSIDSNGNLVAGANTFVLGTCNSDEGLALVGDESAAILNELNITSGRNAEGDADEEGEVYSSDLTAANIINIEELINQAWAEDLEDSGKWLTYADLSAFQIGKDGVITVTYNSEMKAIARIELATFDNQEGLIEDGNTSFTETSASGVAKIKKPGDPGAGYTQSNKLEMSNVNLAQEFSDMIVTQRGYQANARIITTSDSMLEELVNLKR
ncbi:MAG: flagellar hook-basal body complex protein [Oscillospiraceae bacterium]|nr:flagellar hook-basal body complex protein [Oscillospiraceae bacterium]